MRLYTVLHRPGADSPKTGDGGAADPDVVLVKEGFCWPALFLPLLWLLYHRQFWGILAYLALSGVLTLITLGLGMDNLTALLLSLVLSLVVAAQANDWRRWRLTAKGYELVSVVAAGNLAQAEAIFFHTRWPLPGSQPVDTPKETPDQAPARPLPPLPAGGLTAFATPFDPD